VCLSLSLTSTKQTKQGDAWRNTFPLAMLGVACARFLQAGKLAIQLGVTWPAFSQPDELAIKPDELAIKPGVAWPSSLAYPAWRNMTSFFPAWRAGHQAWRGVAILSPPWRAGLPTWQSVGQSFANLIVQASNLGSAGQHTANLGIG
jgi:hypothetical protein